MMETTLLSPFHLTGIQVRTSNAEGKATTDIPALWQQFFENMVMQRIHHRVDDTLYCVYTHYDGDYTQPYTAFLGCRVTQPDPLAEGLTHMLISGGLYTAQTVKGNLNEGVIFKAWQAIWQSNLKRAYTADFEVYDTRAANPEAAEVTIYVSVHD